MFFLRKKGLSQNDKSILRQPLLKKLRKSNEIVLKKSATIQKGIASFQNCCVFSVLCWNLWKTISFFLHCKQVGSQPSVLRFMVHSQNVICHCQQRPLRPDLFCSAKHETAELKIGFHIGKHSLCLDGTVHAKLLSDSSKPLSPSGRRTDPLAHAALCRSTRPGSWPSYLGWRCAVFSSLD